MAVVEAVAAAATAAEVVMTAAAAANPMISRTLPMLPRPLRPPVAAAHYATRNTLPVCAASASSGDNRAGRCQDMRKMD